MLLDTPTSQFLAQVAAISPGLKSIWLVGSRANGTTTSESDWDFIAFGTNETLEFLQNATALHRTRTDFLVVTNDEDFRAAWGEPDKTGSLSEWHWKELNSTEAEYMQSKWIDQEDGAGVKVSRAIGIKVWPL